jgi:RNA polymerase sigma-70 factor (ECF subfamily)
VEERSDSQLIKAYLAGDEASLSILYKRHLRPLYGFVRRIVGLEDAEDVAQEAFVRAWKHLDSFQSERNFKVWLYRIAHNAAVDFIKKNRPIAFSEYEKEDGDDMAGSIEDTTPSVEELFDKSIAASLIRAYLERLTPKIRLVLTLHHLDELTFAEISVALSESIDTIKSRHRRALIKLKGMMESDLDAPK